MNKRLEKRHKREVARARQRVQVSEPDVRTPEQIRAARDASRPPGRRSDIVGGPHPAARMRHVNTPATNTGSKADTAS